MEDRVSVSIAEGVADVRMVRADKMNALDFEMFDALTSTCDRLKTEKGLRAVSCPGKDARSARASIPAASRP
jgi:enoyl-CoA hydratase/carnithine racemase